MNKFMLMSAAASLLIACAPDREVVQIYKGDTGAPGQDGTSCVVQQAESGALLSCSDGSEAYVANGLPGIQGPQGVPGLAGQDGTDGQDGAPGEDGQDGQPGQDGEDGSDAVATLRDYSGSSCTNIIGTTKYVKKNGSNFKLYSTSSCSSFTAFAEVSQGESYWVSTTALAVHADDKLRVITFGGN